MRSPSGDGADPEGSDRRAGTSKKAPPRPRMSEHTTTEPTVGSAVADRPAPRRPAAPRVVRMRADPTLEVIAIELRKPRSWARRVTPRHDLDGPKIRLGVLWFLIVLACWSFGSTAMTTLFACTAGLAGWQAAEAWREFGLEAARPVAAIGAASVTLAAFWSATAVGAAILGFTAIAVLVGGERGAILLVVDPDDDIDDDEIVARADSARGDLDLAGGWSLSDNLAAAGRTIRCGLPVGLAGASAVAVFEWNRLSFLFVFAAASIFDAGDFLCGAGYSSRTIGPTAGTIGVAAVTFGMWVLQPPPFTGLSTFAAGAGLAVACLAGQWLGSLSLPSPLAKAPALRRLDSWLVAAPTYVLCIYFLG